MSFSRRLIVLALLLGSVIALTLVLILIQPGANSHRARSNDSSLASDQSRLASSDSKLSARALRAQQAALEAARNDPKLTEPIKFDETTTFVDSIGIKMIEVRRSCSWVGFTGDPDTDSPERYVDAGPLFLAETEVTRAQWRALYGSAADPSIYPPTAVDANGKEQLDLPVNNVTWSDAVRFCMDLSRREGRNYRLPTEDEWEVACWGRRRSDPANPRDADMTRLAKLSLADAHYAKGHEAFLLGRTKRDMEEAERRSYLQYLQRRPTDSKPSEALEAERQARAMIAASTQPSARLPTTMPTTGRVREPIDPRVAYAVPPGFYAMLGNVAEWTSTRTVPARIRPASRPIEPGDLPTNNANVVESTISSCTWAPGDDDAAIARFDRIMAQSNQRMIFYIVRGGSFDQTALSCTPFNRWALPAFGAPSSMRANVGFRIAMDP